ncbi:hypothetical protein CEB3_c10040 [Peptococcaceae bacterium CEB3]|nr:hypothetical protein CEB3_c10040 [Peptococcaceae bacterium CEB3]
MGRKCFISFKTEDESYKKCIQDNLNINMIDKSLNEAIESEDEDYIMRKIREDYLCDSTVTIHLIGTRGSEDLGLEEQIFVKRELQASLYNGKGNTRNGILGVVLPGMITSVFRGSYTCKKCGETHNWVNVNDSTTIKEFSINYYLPGNDKCYYGEEDRYCVIVGWDDFCANPEIYIEKAFKKRMSKISEKVIVYPK